VIKEGMTLFAHLPEPIRMKNGEHMLVRSKADHILVAEGQRVHREVSREEMSRKCHQMNSYYVCEHIGDMTEKMEATCLGSLFSNNMKAVQKKCNVERVEEEWKVLQLKHNEFSVYVAEPANLVTECRNGTKNNRKINGVSKVAVEEDCSAYTEDFELRSSAVSTMQLTVVQEVDWSMLEMPERSIVIDLDMKNNLSLIRLGSDDSVQVMDEIQERLDWHQDPTVLFWVATGSAAVLGAMCLILLMYAICKYAKYRAETNAPVTE
jgi:hypothetical protein